MKIFERVDLAAIQSRAIICRNRTVLECQEKEVRPLWMETDFRHRRI